MNSASTVNALEKLDPLGALQMGCPHLHGKDGTSATCYGGLVERNDCRWWTRVEEGRKKQRWTGAAGTRRAAVD